MTDAEPLYSTLMLTVTNIRIFADIAMICTQDKMHFEPTLMAMDKKYDLLLEKPISVSPEECYKMYRAAKDAGVKSVVCHVLR